jgi:hypothetical protein
VAQKEPERIVQRLDYLMTELNFLMDTVNLKKVDGQMRNALMQHIYQFMSIVQDEKMIPNSN